MNAVLSRGEKVFIAVSIILLAVLALITMAPFLLIVISSVSSTQSLIMNGYSFIPKSLSLDSYLYMLDQGKTVLRSYGVSLFVTAVGTATGLIITPMLAYPLSRKDFIFRRGVTFLVFFSLLFNGGVVPSYIMWTRLFMLKNTIWALIFPTYLMNGFNVLLVKNDFERNVPKDLIEAAQIDGANEFTIFTNVMIPLSTPVIATVGLFTGLAYWNDWINGLYYINNPSLYGIQQLLIRILDNIAFLRSGTAAAIVGNLVISLPGESIRMALAVIGILPILIVFPLIQKYLIQGIVIGAVKG
jgi:putative aldouronate transport system permease protein